MSGAVTRVKEEVRKILVVAVFFSIGFCLIHVAERLFTAGSNVEIESLTRAIFGGFIVAKVLLMIDLLPFVNAFPDRPLIQNIVWKSSLYVVGAAIFLYIEPLIKHLFKGAGLYAAGAQAWHELMLPRTWAILIWLAMLLIAFVTIQELSTAIGKEQMKHMVFGRRGEPAGEKRFRGAA